MLETDEELKSRLKKEGKCQEMEVDEENKENQPMNIETPAIKKDDLAKPEVVSKTEEAPAEKEEAPAKKEEAPVEKKEALVDKEKADKMEVVSADKIKEEEKEKTDDQSEAKKDEGADDTAEKEDTDVKKGTTVFCSRNFIRYISCMRLIGCLTF